MVNAEVTDALMADFAREAREVGFVAFGVASAAPEKARSDRLRAWLDAGMHGQMGWMAERVAWRDAEWNGPVAVRFTPPDGVTPGLMGTVIDGSADVVDVSATLVDLAVRGYVHLHAEPVTADTPKPPPPPPGMPRRASAAQRTSSSGHDWRMTRLAPPAGGTLLPFERELLNKIFTRSREVTVAELKAHGFDLTMREAQIGLYREVVDRGYYTKHPRDRNRRLGCLGIPLLLLAVGAGIAGITAGTTDFTGKLSAALGVGLGLSALLLLWGGRGRTPRTAVGSAVRIQALGFREYLTKAEANQIRFEEALIFSAAICPMRWSSGWPIGGRGCSPTSRAAHNFAASAMPTST